MIEENYFKEIILSKGQHLYIVSNRIKQFLLKDLLTMMCIFYYIFQRKFKYKYMILESLQNLPGS